MCQFASVRIKHVTSHRQTVNHLHPLDSAKESAPGARVIAPALGGARGPIRAEAVTPGKVAIAIRRVIAMAATSMRTQGRVRLADDCFRATRQALAESGPTTRRAPHRLQTRRRRQIPTRCCRSRDCCEGPLYPCSRSHDLPVASGLRKRGKTLPAQFEKSVPCLQETARYTAPNLFHYLK